MDEALPNLERVTASFPQGDCWSMLGMSSLLVPIGRRVAVQFPSTVQSVYAGDRSFAAIKFETYGEARADILKERYAVLEGMGASSAAAASGFATAGLRRPLDGKELPKLLGIERFAHRVHDLCFFPLVFSDHRSFFCLLGCCGKKLPTVN